MTATRRERELESSLDSKKFDMSSSDPSSERVESGLDFRLLGEL
jgi:hypothetical protein